MGEELKCIRMQSNGVHQISVDRLNVPGIIQNSLVVVIILVFDMPSPPLHLTRHNNMKLHESSWYYRSICDPYMDISIDRWPPPMGKANVDRWTIFMTTMPPV